jgi:hypothetical protein
MLKSDFKATCVQCVGNMGFKDQVSNHRITFIFLKYVSLNSIIFVLFEVDSLGCTWWSLVALAKVSQQSLSSGSPAASQAGSCDVEPGDPSHNPTVLATHSQGSEHTRKFVCSTWAGRELKEHVWSAYESLPVILQ